MIAGRRGWIVPTTLAAGGEAIGAIDTLRDHDGVLGLVESALTVWQTLDEATPAALSKYSVVTSSSTGVAGPRSRWAAPAAASLCHHSSVAGRAAGV